MKTKILADFHICISVPLIRRFIRINIRTGTRKMATIQTYLSSKVSDLDDTMDSAIYFLSTTNKIERW